MGQVERKLGERVAFFRRAAGLSQAELAERIGTSTETVSRLERGVSVPSIVRIEDVARALGVELSDLFRFRKRETARDKALDRLLALLRRRNADEIDLLHDLAARIFRKPGR